MVSADFYTRSAPAVDAPWVSDATQRLYDACGPWAEADRADPARSLLRWLTGIGDLIQPLDDLCRDSEDGPGWSQIVDVNRAPTYVLPWLGQWVGVIVDPTLTDAAQRTQIETEQGFARGTVAALVAAVQPYLTNRRVVHVVERDGGPYMLTVVVFTRDLAGGRWSDLIGNHPTWAAVEAFYPTWQSILGDVDTDLLSALAAAKPAGLILKLLISSGGTWADVEGNFRTWGQVVTDFATWNDLINWAPPS
ncbi:MAG: phage tail protein [Actinomycetota bacterium]|nr:phage tail protein [Actinomycetota bacterium]